MASAKTVKKPRPPQGILPNDTVFPRRRALFGHSPLFWVENKDRFLRQLMIADIEAVTGRRLCVYFASPYFSSELVQDDIARLYEVANVERDRPFDLLLETGGGYTDATEGLVSMLQSVNPDFRVIVPSRAKSNGTVICLAGTEIIMGPTSELGPIEPSVDNIPVSILREDEYKLIDFQLHKLGHNAFLQTKKLAHRLLSSGMMKGSPEKEVEETVAKLCTRDHFHSHGSVINGTEATDLGLKIKVLAAEDELWRRVWILQCMYAFDSNLRGIGKIFEGRYHSRVIVGNDPA